MREDFIHYHIRQFLKEKNWELIAGQYPNGSDDELPSLNIMDPKLSCGNSPDHRRHSKNKLVPDLVAIKQNFILLVEMKPKYSMEDEKKLLKIVGERRTHLIESLRCLVAKRKIKLIKELDELIFIPALGLSHKSKICRKENFCYFRVHNDAQIVFEGNKLIPNI